MKDIMFFIGMVCWLGWLIDTCYYIVKKNPLFHDITGKLIQFLAITLVTISWYIV